MEERGGKSATEQRGRSSSGEASAAGDTLCIVKDDNEAWRGTDRCGSGLFRRCSGMDIKKEAALDGDTSDFSHRQGLLLSVLGI